MIFAAGLGTRLKPLTDTIPKALIPVKGVPMLEIMMRRLIQHGVKEVVVNVHYLYREIERFLQINNNFGIQIHISYEKEAILETGGGLWVARKWLRGDVPFFVCNADIFTDIDFTKLLETHLHSDAIATLAIRNRESSRQLLFDDTLRLCGWRNSKVGKSIIPVVKENLTSYAFSGIHVISPSIFDTCAREGKFGLIDWYLDICANHPISGYIHNQDTWIDIGSIQSLNEANAL